MIKQNIQYTLLLYKQNYIQELYERIEWGLFGQGSEE
jgi:hypothetical protein